MDEEPVLVTYDVLKLNDLPKKMAWLREQVILLLAKWMPDVVCWENLKSNQNPDTIRKLGEITGCIREVVETKNYEHYEYIPVSIRAKLCRQKTGKQGRGTKQDLAYTLCDMFGLEFPKKRNGEDVTSDQHEFFNITDAIGVGLYHIWYGGKDAEREKEHKSSSKKRKKV